MIARGHAAVEPQLRQRSSGGTVRPTLGRWKRAGQAIPTRLRTDPHMSGDLRVSLTVKCSKTNSDVTRVFRDPREHRGSAPGAKASPRARRRLIFGYQIVSGNHTESFKWDSGVGG